MQKQLGLQMAGLAVILVLLLSGCATKAGSGTAIGAATGAIAGQAIGRDTKGTLIGAAVGGLLGYIIGNEMDKYDQEKLNQTFESSPSYQQTHWVNPDTNRSYTVTPQPAYTQPSGQVCREAEILATVDGRPEKVTSIACRDNTGRWVIQQ
jgi:surface antigen